MERREFSTPKGMRDWLKDAVGIAITSIGFMASGDTLYTNMSSPLKIGAALEECSRRGVPDETACFIEYDLLEYEDLPSDLELRQYLSALVVEAKLARSDSWYGSHEKLTSHLADYEYLVSMRPSGPGYRLGFVLVKMPDSPNEVEKLRAILETKGGFMVIVPDGTDEIHIGNTFFGKNPLNHA